MKNLITTFKQFKFYGLATILILLSAALFATNSVMKYRAKKAKAEEKVESLTQMTTVNNYIGELTPSAPSVAGFQKAINFPQGSFTGVQSTNIPIHNYVEGNLQIPISLNYNSSGIKVNEYASWVGLGWTLYSGGSISRQVMGGPDEGHSMIGCSNYSGWYKDNGYESHLAHTLAPIPCLSGTGNSPNISSHCGGLHSDYNCTYYEASKGCIDTEPDIFYLNLKIL